MKSSKTSAYPPRPSSFQFIPLSRPDQELDPRTLSQIRRHAMKDIGISRRKPKKKNIKEPDVQLEPPRLHPAIDNNSVLPFLKLPFELDGTGRELLANVFRDTGDCLQIAHRADWFTVGVADPASFNLILANSELHLDRLRFPELPPRETPLSLFYHQKAISAIREQLSTIPLQVTDGMMGSVAGLFAYAYIAGLLEQWQMQRGGLMNLIKLRPGGLESIPQNEHLHAAISWIELRGACMSDVRPIIPLPQKWISAYQNAHGGVLQKPIRDPPHPEDWPEVFHDIVRLCRGLNEYPEAELWQRPLPDPLCNNVAINKLLRLRPLEDPELDDVNEANMIEAYRLGMLLYISPIWRMNGVSQVRTEAFLSKLKHFVINRNIDWGGLWHLYLWVLLQGAMESRDISMRGYFVSSLVEVIVENRIESKNKFLNIVEGVAWLRVVFDDGMESILVELQGHLGDSWPSHGAS